MNRKKKYVKAVRHSMLQDFVPLDLGFACFTRQNLLENSSQMANQFYGGEEKVILVADGTYIFCQKSKNYELQRLTYSDQKKRNFVKPMVILTTNGTFVDILGPYQASKNDASI